MRQKEAEMTHNKKTKEAILLKALNRGEKTLSQIAEENNVGYSTLQRWLSVEKQKDPTFIDVNKISKKEKLQHVILTDGLSEELFSSYCRKIGLYRHQIEKWRREFECEESAASNKDQEIKEYKKQTLALKAELNRKEKALAEASALLILKKKANLIWGDGED